MLCPKCGYYTDREDTVCPECGEKVLPPGMTICQECGELVEQGKFCTECGCKSATDILPNAETKNPPSSDSDLSGVRVDAFGNIVSDSASNSPAEKQFDTESKIIKKAMVKKEFEEQNTPPSPPAVETKTPPTTEPALRNPLDEKDTVLVGVVVFLILAVFLCLVYAIVSSR